MAQKIEVTLVDDLDGSEAAETVQFSLDGTDYEIDLSGQNADSLRTVFAQYVDVARKASGRVRRAGSRAGRPARAVAPANGRPDDVDPREVRAWAVENNIPVNPRGRVPQALVLQFTEAHAES